MDAPTNIKKFSLFPCQDISPIIRETPVMRSPTVCSINSPSMSISSSGRPRTAGGSELPKPSVDSLDRPLPPIPRLEINGKPGKSKKYGKEKEKGEKEKGEKEKTTFRSLRKQVVSGFQHFSTSLKLKGSKEKTGSKKSYTHEGIGVAA